MVGVGVRQHDQVQRVDPVPSQPRHGRIVRAAVHEYPNPGGFDQDRVSLPDVDGRDRERRRGVTRQRQHREQQRSDGHARGGPGGDPAGPTHEPDRDPRGRHQCQRAVRSDDATPPVKHMGDREQETSGDRGQDERWHAESGVDDRQERTTRRHGRCDRRQRDRDEVGGDRRHRQLPLLEDQEWRDGDLGADGDGQQVRGPTRRQPSPDQRSQQQHTGGGERRQQETGRPGKSRIGDDEEQDGTGQRVDGIAPDASRRGEQHQPRHHAGPQDAGLESRQDSEPEDSGDHDPTRPARPDLQKPGQGNDARDDQRHVGATHRNEVGETRCAHGLLVGSRQQPGIPRHQAHRQAGRSRRRGPSRRGADRGADLLRRAAEPPWCGDLPPRRRIESGDNVEGAQMLAERAGSDGAGGSGARPT